MLELLAEWLHFNATLTNKQLHAYINREILRKILIEKEIALSDGEKSVGSLLAMKTYLENEEIKALYKQRFIKSERTIGKWLNGVVYTRKHVIKEKTTINSKETKKARLIYAKMLKKLLLDENRMCISIDEMSFYQNLASSTGRSPKGEREVVKTLPVSNLAFWTQVAIAVESSLGLIHGAAFPPEKQTRLKQDG